MKKKTKQQIVNKTWMNVREVASYLGISKETIYRRLETGSIPSHRLGKLYRFEKSEIDEWVKSGDAE